MFSPPKLSQPPTKQWHLIIEIRRDYGGTGKRGDIRRHHMKYHRTPTNINDEPWNKARDLVLHLVSPTLRSEATNPPMQINPSPPNTPVSQPDSLKATPADLRKGSSHITPTFTCP